MKTEIKIQANLTNEQLDVLITEIQNTAEMIGIDLKVESDKLSQHDVMVRSEQLPCSHCGRPLKEHSKDSKLCPDRMKNFEQGN